LLSALRATGDIRVLLEAAGTLTVTIASLPTSFFHYDYPLLLPLHHSPWGIPLADPADIAAMKLWAIAGRGSRKDFVDFTPTCWSARAWSASSSGSGRSIGGSPWTHIT
jgi:hypothetical protein